MRRLLVASGILAIGLVWARLTPARVVPADIHITGPLSESLVLEVLRSRTHEVRRCVDEAHRRHADLAGRLTLKWVVQSSGAVEGPSVISKLSTLHDAALIRCMTATIQGWTFARRDAPSNVTCSFEVSAARSKDRDAVKSPKRKIRGERESAVAESSADDVLGSEGGGLGYASGKSGRVSGRAGMGRSTASPSAPRVKPTITGPKRAPSKSERKSGAADLSLEPVDRAPAASRSVAAPAMKAGRHDDNKQYNRFLKFLADNKHLVVYPLPINERLAVRALDKNDRSLHNCKIEVLDATGKVLTGSVTYADGSTHFFPADKSSASIKSYRFRAICGDKVGEVEVTRNGPRTTELKLAMTRTVPKRVPVDIAFVLDTTGSMQSQIDRLKKTLQAIHVQLTSLATKPDIRFALVAYRDRGDDYVTQVTPFTSKVESFQKKLDRIEADGGGDTPEDLQEALKKAMQTLRWRGDALRIGFVIADAIPHTDYGQKYTYRSAMRESLARGIKWCTVGAGGLPRKGEVIFRQLAQYTMGEYVFVTQGSRGDSDGGVGEASHHVGTNYRVENLDQAIVRIVRRELSYLTDEPRDFDYTIVATGTKATPRDKILAPAVKEALRQLTDYCAIRLSAKTPVAVVPVDTPDKSFADVSEYLTEQLILMASREPDFRVLERDLRAVAQEHKLQLSDLFEVENTVPFGKLVGAQLLIVSRLTVRGEVAELYAKMVRVETGEILSAAKVHFKGGVVKGALASRH